MSVRSTWWFEFQISSAYSGYDNMHTSQCITNSYGDKYHTRGSCGRWPYNIAVSFRVTFFLRGLRVSTMGKVIFACCCFVSFKRSTMLKYSPPKKLSACDDRTVSALIMSFGLL